MYYTVKVKISMDSEKGVKTRNEEYLVSAESVTEAEANLTADFEGYPADWVVTGVAESKIIRVIEPKIKK